MIEYVLTTFSDKAAAEIPILEDGSMHLFRKQWHPNSINNLADWPDSGITTPIYPFRELHLPDIIKQFEHRYPAWNQHRKILIYAPNQTWCEINLLFQYHKISVGLDLGLEIFQTTDLSIPQQWHHDHKSYRDLQRWQWREWFSIFYPGYVQEWQESLHQVNDSWLCITNRDLLNDTEATLYSIARFCGIDINRPIEFFCRAYASKQDYVCKEYNLINDIVSAIIDHQHMTWQPLSIVGEAILQQKFRQQGYEWQCDGLDILPCDSIMFEKLLYQPEKDIHA